jgi:hypothetical protein
VRNQIGTEKGQQQLAAKAAKRHRRVRAIEAVYTSGSTAPQNPRTPEDQPILETTAYSSCFAADHRP